MKRTKDEDEETKVGASIWVLFWVLFIIGLLMHGAVAFACYIARFIIGGRNDK